MPTRLVAWPKSGPRWTWTVGRMIAGAGGNGGVSLMFSGAVAVHAVMYSRNRATRLANTSKPRIGPSALKLGDFVTLDR